jgi:enoyl-CoA hydratase
MFRERAAIEEEQRMDYETLLVERRDRLAIVTINRPEKLNALNAKAKTELGSLFNALRDDPDISVVIVTGAGEKAFVAGTDIGELAVLNEVSGKQFAKEGQELFYLIEHLGKPVIAAVNGYALGGGAELAMACHMRFASENAKFGQPEVNLGIIPGYGGTQRLARLVGVGRAMEIILTGGQIDAGEALRIGLYNRVVPLSDLMKTVEAVAQTIIGKGQVAVRLALEAVCESQEATLAAGLSREADLFARCCGSGDFKEGTKAFLEKRKPLFTGK